MTRQRAPGGGTPPLAWALGLAVTALLLFWTLHGVDSRAVLEHIRRADPVLFGLAIALATATFPLRAIRWRVILARADGAPFPFGPLWRATAVGFMANHLLPARAGEVARAYMATRELPVRLTTALGSIAVERVFDGVIMVGLLFAALAAPSAPARDSEHGAVVTGVAQWAAALFIVALAAAFIVARRPARSLALLRRVFTILPRRFAERLTDLAAGVIAGLAVLNDLRLVARVLAWSLVLWTVNALSFAVCFRAFALPVPWESAFALQALIGFGVAVPSSPGFFGPFEAVTRLTLGLYGVGAERAVSYAVAYHIGGFIPITLLGLHALSQSRVRLAQLRHPEGLDG